MQSHSYIQQNFSGHECLRTNLPRPRNPATTCQSIHLYSTLCPFPLLTLCLPKKLTSVSPEGSISHKPREGLCPCTYTDRLTRSGWCFNKLRGLTLTQQRKSLCLRGITPIPISKKGYRGEEAYSLIDQKKRPSENRDLCHDHLHKGRMLSTFFSPKLQRPLPWPPETRYTGTASSSGIESFTPETRHWEACRPTYLPRTFALTFQRCFRCTGMAVNFFPAEFFPNKLPWTVLCSFAARVLNQAPFTSLQQIFSMPTKTKLVAGPKE